MIATLEKAGEGAVKRGDRKRKEMKRKTISTAIECDKNISLLNYLLSHYAIIMLRSLILLSTTRPFIVFRYFSHCQCSKNVEAAEKY